jgi:hypothetical protein
MSTTNDNTNNPDSSTTNLPFSVSASVRPTCHKCGKNAVSVRERREGFKFNICYDCRHDMALELRKLGISVMTSNAMVSSGRLKEWTDFAGYASDSWIGVRNLGPKGRQQIAAALSLYERVKNKDAELNPSPHQLFHADPRTIPDFGFPTDPKDVYYKLPHANIRIQNQTVIVTAAVEYVVCLPFDGTDQSMKRIADVVNGLREKGWTL